jgi:hypothetical protein
MPWRQIGTHVFNPFITLGLPPSSLFCLHLAASQDNLPIHEDKLKGVYVKGLLEVYVASTEEVFEVMRRGGNARVVAYTSKGLFNMQSLLPLVLTHRHPTRYER